MQNYGPIMLLESELGHTKFQKIPVKLLDHQPFVK